jgi:hypothetical protein
MGMRLVLDVDVHVRALPCNDGADGTDATPVVACALRGPIGEGLPWLWGLALVSIPDVGLLLKRETDITHARVR